MQNNSVHATAVPVATQQRKATMTLLLVASAFLFFSIFNMGNANGVLLESQRCYAAF